MTTANLESAIALLEYDVAQHVAALAAARAKMLDTAIIDALTDRVVAATEALARSNGTEVAPAPEAAPETPQAPLPAFLTAPQSALG